jgi:lipoate-protein ligase A
MTQRLRLLDMGSVDPLDSQAVYHGLAEAAKPSDDPSLILIRPNAPYVCVGAHQELDKEVDVAYCQEAGLPLYRRHVGGGAVLLDPDQLFFQFVVPNGHLSKGPVTDLFPYFIEPVVDTYRSFGVEAEFRPVNDIHVAGRKIGGTGAATIGEAVVLVGSFMYRFDRDTMARALHVSSEKFRDKLRAALNDYVASMDELLSELPSQEELQGAFAEALRNRLGWQAEPGQVSDAEWAAVAEARQGLTDPDWLWQRGRKMVPGGFKIQADAHLTEGQYKAPGGLIRATVLTEGDRIGEVVLSGDMMVFPEAGLDNLAQRLAGAPRQREALADAVASAWESEGLEMPGVGPQDVAEAVQSAVEGQ